MVVKIQGRPVSSTAPLTGQVMGWDGAQWTPQSAGGRGLERYVDGSASHRTKPAGRDFRAGNGSGIGVGRGAVGARPYRPGSGGSAGARTRLTEP
jgi:hypothetical protein